MDPLTISLIAQGASGVLQGLIGGGQRRKAKKLLSTLQEPMYEVPNEVLQSQKMAQIGASEGLPSQQYKQAAQNIARQQNQAIQSSMDRRGGLMNVAKSQQIATDALLDLDVADANARLANRRTLYDVNNQVAGYRDRAFDINRLQPYLRNRQYAMSLLGAGNQNLWGGVDKAIGGAFGSVGNSGGGQGGGQSFIGDNNGLFGATNQPIYGPGYNRNSVFSNFETATGY